ncbi:MAG: T9SS type A sorting domain-containing protein [Bacteroidota bacterium]
MKQFLRCIIIFLFLSTCGYSQESIIYIQTPHNQLKSEETKAQRESLNSLPFFDDFAYPYTYPNSNNWIDTDAYINTAFGKNAPTIGIATLDALQSDGTLYENASNSQFIADYLSSQPLNLESYQIMYRSDQLYNSEFELLENDYYLYTNNSFKPVTDVSAFYAGDTLYTFNGSSYVPFIDSLYHKKDNDYIYIQGSYDFLPEFLEYSIDDNIALSFQYQAGGYGNKPNERDSLVVEFYIPTQREGVFINEITTQAIELYNASDSIIHFDTLYIIPNHLDSILMNDLLENYLITDISISPYSHQKISAQNFSIETISHAYFYLLQADSTVIDSVTHNQEITNNLLSARIPDGAETWSVTTTQTLGTCNPAWQRMWATSTDTLETFSQAFIPIPESFLHKGFRFRFKNYASLSTDISHSRNQDFWNIDMVWLAANRTNPNQNISDIAFVKPLKQLYSSYSSVPLSHFSEVSQSDFRMSVEMALENFDSVSHQISFNFSVLKKHTNEKLTFSTTPSWFVQGYTYGEELDILSAFDISFYNFIASDIGLYERGTYEFQHYFSDNVHQLDTELQWNDTNRVRFILDNYYAYDDGIPEAGYGLRNAPLGRVAYKYSPLKADTLKAIDIYFNPTLYENATFTLCVWKANELGMPGELLYKMPGENVSHDNGLYNFKTYTIKNEGIIGDNENGLYIDSVIFIGWQQPYDILLNVGLDLQSTIARKIYYNTGYEWLESSQSGALLMRPVFGELNEDQTHLPKLSKTVPSAYLYPSIASSHISVYGIESNTPYILYAMNGTKISEGTIQNQNLSVAHLQSSLYYLKIKCSDGNIQTLSFVKK